MNTIFRPCEGVDKRSAQALERMARQMGCIAVNHTGYTTWPEVLTSHGVTSWEITANWTLGTGYWGGRWICEVYRYGNRWATQWNTCWADDYALTTAVWEKKPTLQKVKKLLALLDLYTDLMLGRLETTFHCWECGKLTHFLDIPGTWEEKVRGLREEYCGC